MSKLIAGYVAILLVGLAGGFWLGKTTERAALLSQVNTAQAEKASCDVALLESKAAIDKLVISTEMAERVRKEAQKRADALAGISATKLTELNKIIADANTCGEVLQSYWKVSQ